MKGKTRWIWYPGDFEIYHGMKQNFRREERGVHWPAFWKMDDWNKNVFFSRVYRLEQPASFRVKGIGDGYVRINNDKYLFGQEIICPAGEWEIKIFVGKMDGLPCAFVEGDVIFSDETWVASDFVDTHPVGTSSLFTRMEQNPNFPEYAKEVCCPLRSENMGSGVLLDFGRLIDGVLELTFRNPEQEITVCYGESREEALDPEWCYYRQEHVTASSELARRAFRFVCLLGCEPGEVTCRAIHQYLPIPVKGSFRCDNDRMNRIWEVASETYRLCSGLFFIDGMKRDRWIWSGDAYQNFFVNPYLFFDEEIDKRTLLALRGNLGIRQHLNTILDYSLLWVIAVKNEYFITGDREFVKMIFPKLEDLMRLVASQLDEHGFVRGRAQDWIFIDWADIDKTGAVCAEQMLLAAAYRAAADCAVLADSDPAYYQRAAEKLTGQVEKFFWREEKGAFIDSFESGKFHVSRHANIFAILFDLVGAEKRERIVRNVLLNPQVPQITTPYFRFFELDVLCKLGYLEQVWAIMQEYWGGMLDRGAVTFWEEFNPAQTGPEQYSMYGDPYGKSLCHAWGASPIYLLGRYYLGVYPTSAGYGTFTVEPQMNFFKKLDSLVPVKNGFVQLHSDGEYLTVKTDSTGGTLKLASKEILLPINERVTFKL